MIFLDSNIPMYIVGADHPLKPIAQRMLQRMIDQPERMVTNVEVLQEILYRYSSMNRWKALDDAYETILGLVDEVFPVDRRDVERARMILREERTLSSRDAVHVAVMERHNVKRIMTFDVGFDRVPGITRISS